MGYPNSVDKFNEKLNKSDTVYVIEEEVFPTNGVYENILAHDNIIDSSVNVYTGRKLTGDKVNNVILSIPDGMPWKRIIKIFSEAQAVFITYETKGDQVEAEDINQLQTSMTATQTEVNRYKTANDLAVSNAVNRVTALENNKAEKTYVDTELLKKADKASTYTKTETDNRIQAVVGAAPAALDTLNEIAAALNDDPNFAGTMTAELTKKVDKVSGKQLSTNDYTTSEKTKLAGVETGANKYVHPTTHPATIIVEDALHRFITDADKINWNGKLNATDNAVSASKLATGRTIALSGDVTGSIVFDGASNVTITAAVADDSHNHIIANIDGLQNALDGKETPVSAQAKADAAEANAKAYSMNMVSLGSSADPNTTQEAYILTNHANSPGGGVYWHILTFFYGTKTGNKAQIAVTYNGSTPRAMVRHIYGATWTAWQELETTSGAQSKANQAETNAKSYADGKFATKSEIGDAGYGDMMKSVYDKNNNGTVDAAESIPWTGVTGKPSNFPPTAHTHDSISVIDVRTISDSNQFHDPLPNLFDKGFKTFFSSAYPGGGWRSALTLKGWNGSYAAWQLIGPASTTVDDNFYLRSGIGDSWRDFRKIWHDGNDGAGSGLDADLLDGKHASEFATTSHTHMIANITGLQSALDNKMSKGPLTWNDLKGV